MVRSIQGSAKLCEEHMQPATMGVLSVLASADNAVFNARKYIVATTLAITSNFGIPNHT